MKMKDIGPKGSTALAPPLDLRKITVCVCIAGFRTPHPIKSIIISGQFCQNSEEIDMFVTYAKFLCAFNQQKIWDQPYKTLL